MRILALMTGLTLITGCWIEGRVRAQAPDAAYATSQPTSAASGPLASENVPDSPSGAVELGKKAAAQLRAKQWFAMSASIIWLLMFVFKTLRKTVPLMQRIPKRVLWIIVPCLSIAAMVLAKLEGDLSWDGALAVLLSGPAVAFSNDLVKRGLLGREPTTAVNSGV